MKVGEHASPNDTFLIFFCPGCCSIAGMRIFCSSLHLLLLFVILLVAIFSKLQSSCWSRSGVVILFILTLLGLLLLSFKDVNSGVTTFNTG